MAFGEGFGQIVEHIVCPRCQSEKAVVRSKLTNFKFYENHIVCTKCHFVRFVQAVTREDMEDQHLLMRLKAHRENATTKTEQYRLDKKIDIVEERLILHGLTRFGGK